MPRAGLLALLAVLFAAMVALGTWQVQRRAWKLDLIERVEQRLAADPVAAPGPRDWSQIGQPDEYRRLIVTGTFRHDLETCTQAVTVRGPGCWVLTPLQTAEGWWLLVNRGFVDPQQRDASMRAAGQVAGLVTVSGLLRLSEPGGGFLRANDPAQERWTSRDVAAIAKHRALPATDVAPYFLDAAETVPGGPVGGLTVVRFRNSHLVYALTWYGLAALAAFGGVLVLRAGRSPAEPWQA
jgi:surfeit locus 1 family protein